MPNVIVVVSNYNHARLLEPLDSIMAQTFTDFEVISLADASRNNPDEVIRRTLNWHVVRMQEDAAPL